MTALTVFALIAAAELPDKSMVASVVLGSRYRHLWVWLGATAAFVVHAGIAVAAGGLLSRAPHAVVTWVTIGVFAAGAVFLFWTARSAAAPDEDDTASAVRSASRARGFGAAFGAVMLTEWGDITQIATANMAASYADPVSVFIGAAAGLSACIGVGLLAGRWLQQHVSPALIQRVAAVLMLMLAVVEAARELI